ncbi:glutathione S-transferase N-terminal domain-containing protein [Thioalkalivibrio sp. ALJ24]|uniref:glutaredoxin family protein n=1 Tax=Thioalkalivibrio sp. ALJ24 TaxID=545276 RepID=UPI00036A5DF6|nr:glutathione S-transferase N-terminal domain-containing protein [Thioalkalivibrio sp. ALJ24]
MRPVIRLFFRGVRLVLTPFMLVGERVTRPRGVQRDPEEQARVDEQTRAMALYHFPACPFCIKARRAMQRLSLDIELRNAQAAGEHRETLQTEGGKLQVPCLRIEEPDGSVRWLYESGAIIEYLESRFDPQRAGADTESS